MSRYRFLYIDGAVWRYQDLRYHANGTEGENPVEAYIQLAVATLLAGHLPEPANDYAKNGQDRWTLTSPRMWLDLDGCREYVEFTLEERHEIEQRLAPWVKTLPSSKEGA